MFSIIADPDIDETQAQALGASLQAQVYDRWELFVPDTIGTGERTRPLPLGRRFAGGPDQRRRWPRRAGDLVFLPRPGTMFRPHALAVFAATLERYPDAKLIYADDDDFGGGPRRGAREPALQAGLVARPGAELGLSRRSLLHRDRNPARGRRGTRGGPAGAAARPPAAGDRELPAAAVVHVAQILSHTLPYARASSTPEDRAIVRGHVERPDAATRVLADPRSPHPRVVHEIPDPPLVSLIIPTRDRAELLKRAVGTIRTKTSYPPYEILVVDNGSREDDTQKLFESWASDSAIRVLRDDAPFNYAALNNRAAAAARGTVLGLVNNDVEVIDGGWLDEMVSLALDPASAASGPSSTTRTGGCSTAASSPGSGARPGIATSAPPAPKRGMLDSLVTVNEVSAVTAACLVVRKAVYLEVGGLDADTFAVAYNDVDFCLKVAAAGYRNLWTPFAELNHHESVSRGRDLSPRTAERFNRENLNLRLRWGDRLLDDPYYSPNLTVETESVGIRTQ